MSQLAVNELHYGDNLGVLREKIPVEVADLVYLDPPFNSSRSTNLLFKQVKGEPLPAQIHAFLTWSPLLYEQFEVDCRNAGLNEHGSRERQGAAGDPSVVGREERLRQPCAGQLGARLRRFKRGVGACFASLLLLLIAEPAHAQSVSLWGGVGAGFFLTGGSRIDDPDWHQFAAVALSLPGDQVRLRCLIGSLVHDEQIPSHVGDDDLDYTGLDAVVTRRATRLPFDLAFGVTRYEEAYHRGYPHFDHGGRVLIHRWGPHVSLLRDVPLWRSLSAWGEADLHYAPYQPRQVFCIVDAGLGLSF